MKTKDLQKLIARFRDDRDWKQFNNPKDLSISLLLEAAELLEHFQWESKEEVETLVRSKKMKEIKEEMADVYYWILLMAHDLGVDLEEELLQKMKQNEEKYPVAKARGSHKKYNEL